MNRSRTMRRADNKIHRISSNLGTSSYKTVNVRESDRRKDHF